MLHPQLTLALGTASSSSFESYWPGEVNANALASVRAFCAGELQDQQLLVWGGDSVGKTHLLSAACQDLANRGYQVAYLTGDLASSDGALLGIEQAELFCLDDLQDLSQQSEEALFHCINRCRESGTRLLFAARTPVDELSVALPDLKTRLSWGAVFQLHALPDADLAAALQRLLSLRGLAISEDVSDYILRRYPRSMSAITDLVDQLDQASMSEQRRITIPLVRSLSEETTP